MGLIESILSDNTEYTKPIVTRIKRVHIVKKEWVRLVGIQCDIVYEIQLLELKPYHLDAKANIRPIIDSTINTDMRCCWKVEQRTIFRSFQEMLDFFQSFEDKRAVLDLATLMKGLDFGDIFIVKDEIAKSCEYIDKALRLITFDPELCDSMKLKSFLGMFTNGDSGIVPRIQKDSIESITIPCGKSVDSFVISWGWLKSMTLSKWRIIFIGPNI